MRAGCLSITADDRETNCQSDFSRSLQVENDNVE